MGVIQKLQIIGLLFMLIICILFAAHNSKNLFLPFSDPNQKFLEDIDSLPLIWTILHPFCWPNFGPLPATLCETRPLSFRLCRRVDSKLGSECSLNALLSQLCRQLFYEFIRLTTPEKESGEKIKICKHSPGREQKQVQKNVYYVYDPSRHL